jgi:aminoglycoside phosphotransferase (APT) family kinase protein
MMGGQDNVVEVGTDGTLTRRRRGPDDSVLDVAQEAALLAIVRRISPLPVPRVLDVLAGENAMVMERLEGRPLLELTQHVDEAIARRLGDQLGRFLASLHMVRLDRLDGVVPVEDSPLLEHHRDAERTFEALRHDLPREVTSQVGNFLAAPLPSGGRRRSLCHNDLGAEHVLVRDPGFAITGVIDWSDASISDPALDLGLIWRDLGTAGFEAARAHVGPSVDMTARARYFARVKALEDFEYGLTPGRDDYRDNAVRALLRLFGSS